MEFTSNINTLLFFFEKSLNLTKIGKLWNNHSVPKYFDKCSHSVLVDISYMKLCMQINGDGRLRHRRTTNVTSEIITSDNNDHRLMVSFRKIIFVNIVRK